MRSFIGKLINVILLFSLDHPFYSTHLAAITGLRTPYEQWALVLSSGGLAVKGAPRIREGYWAMKLLRAVETSNMELRDKYSQRLNLSAADIEQASSNTFLQSLRDKKLVALKWMGLGVFLSAYIIKAKFLQEIRYLTRKT